MRVSGFGTRERATADFAIAVDLSRLPLAVSLSHVLFSLLSLSLSLSLSLCDSNYLLGQLAGEELVELGVEDAVGDELFFIFFELF